MNDRLTLQRMESNEDIRVGYQELATLAKFYGVSTDYLFGLTDNLTAVNVEISDLHLSDRAIEILKSKKTNNRLIGEIISHDDFCSFINSIEMYIDRKYVPQMNTMNMMYKVTDMMDDAEVDKSDTESVISYLKEAMTNEDSYLRYQISERFNMMIRDLFELHKKDAVSVEQETIANEMVEDLRTFIDKPKNSSTVNQKLTLLAKQLDINVSHLTEDELNVLRKALEHSPKFRATQSHGGNKKKKR